MYQDVEQQQKSVFLGIDLEPAMRRINHVKSFIKKSFCKKKTLITKIIRKTSHYDFNHDYYEMYHNMDPPMKRINHVKPF